MEIRETGAEDLEEVIRLTSATRRQLAAWSPVYFRPREGADVAHAQFLEFVVGSSDQQASVFVINDSVVGFFRQADLPKHVWVDDLCLRDPGLWNEAARTLVECMGSTSWVTCVSPHDADRLDALSSAGLAPISMYWSKSLPSSPSMLETEEAPTVPEDRPAGPTHTFGGIAFDPGAPGALVACDPEGNYAIGSPGVEPPIYDPGGPTCVVDQLGGPDRGVALDLGHSAATARGDAQLVVVSAADDEELRYELETKGFEIQVVLLASQRR
ncbi:MAG: hypothetical protein F4Z02_12115 [Acidimicrobiia bacterium]|nr:hypothetical protein [Acidimicrobiia bacterium]MYG71174.1 hypothetical protein [Acidimicrobiia bacterium]